MTSLVTVGKWDLRWVCKAMTNPEAWGGSFQDFFKHAKTRVKRLDNLNTRIVLQEAKDIKMLLMDSELPFKKYPNDDLYADQKQKVKLLEDMEKKMPAKATVQVEDDDDEDIPDPEDAHKNDKTIKQDKIEVEDASEDEDDDDDDDDTSNQKKEEPGGDNDDNADANDDASDNDENDAEHSGRAIAEANDTKPADDDDTNAQESDNDNSEANDQEEENDCKRIRRA